MSLFVPWVNIIRKFETPNPQNIILELSNQGGVESKPPVGNEVKIIDFLNGHWPVELNNARDTI